MSDSTAQKKSGKDEFNTYSWETDEGWIKIEKRLIFPVGISTFKKRKVIEKRKLKYYKKEVNPDYTPPPKPTLSSKADPTKAPETKPAESKPAANAEPSESADKKEDPKENTNEPKEAKTENTPGGELPNGTFVKLQLTNAKYTGLVGEIEKFLPGANRYSVKLHLPETLHGLYANPIKVVPSNVVPTSRMPLYGEMLLHCVVLMCALVSIFSKRFYSYCLYASILVSFLGLTYLKGRPSFNQDYAQSALQSSQACNLMCALALLMAKPYVFLLAPPLCRSVNRGFGMLSDMMAKDCPSLHARLKPLIDPVLARRRNFNELATKMEVYTGLGLVLGMFLGISSFSGVFLYWNFLRMKYLFSLELQRVFHSLKSSVDQTLNAYPSVKGYWQKACDYAYSYVNREQMRQQYDQMSSGSGGMMSKLKNMCNIM